MDKYRKLKEAFDMMKDQRPEATLTNTRKAILSDEIHCRRTSTKGRAWIFVRAIDILNYWKNLEKKINK